MQFRLMPRSIQAAPVAPWSISGAVIGVNSAIATMTGGVTGDQSGNIGVGFAIPAEQVLTTVGQIIKTGQAQYPVIGAGVRGTESMDGATVTVSSRVCPQPKLVLKVDDVVRKVNGRPIAGSIDLVVAIRSQVAGEQVTLLIERGGKTQRSRSGSRPRWVDHGGGLISTADCSRQIGVSQSSPLSNWVRCAAVRSPRCRRAARLLQGVGHGQC
ncbi:MAG: PDZ domain-containing protein [Marmoricola sp.]